MEEIQHFAHQCSSTLLETTGDGTCSLCCKETSIHYTCNDCGFDLCKSCFKLSPRLVHTLHPQHPLEFSLRQPGRRPQLFICCGCGYVSSGSFYECKECDIKVDLECVSEEITRRWDQKSMYHYGHRHMLSRCKPGQDFSGTCLMCELHVSDMAVCYGCVYCGCFIHEWCIDLPRDVQHPVHPPHTLSRLGYVQLGGRKIRCNACQDLISGVPFSCVECRFNLHMGCADSLLRRLKHESHPHGLFYAARNAAHAFNRLKRCQICKRSGKIFNNCYYHCLECDSNIHFECLRIPTFVVSKSRHLHPIWCRTLDDPSDYYCDVCEAIMSPGSHGYCCRECDFRAHIECILSEEEPSPMYLKYLYSSGEEVARTGRGREDNKLMIEDISHTHLLELSDAADVSNKPCNICHRIIVGRVYICGSCEFRAHESCGELGQRSNRVHRNHPLTLLPIKPTDDDMLCDNCKRPFHGFNLFCRTCDYVICIRCAIQDTRSVQRVVTEKRTCMQGHHLVQFHGGSKPVPCGICGEKVHGDGASTCPVCNETYHVQCLELPRDRVRRPFHPHLVYLEREPRLPICGDCGHKIQYYSYNCHDCIGSYHIKCPEPAEASLKVSFHEHNLYHSRGYVEDTEGDDDSETYLECNICSRGCGNSFYSCSECDFNCHVECLGLPNYIKHRKHRHILTLKHSLTETTKDAPYCVDCRFECDPIGPGYTCELCSFVFHVECLMSTDEWEIRTLDEHMRDMEEEEVRKLKRITSFRIGSKRV